MLTQVTISGINILMKTLKLAFLGTGTCNATPNNPQSLLFSNGEELVAVDFGGGAYHQISRLQDEHFNYRNLTTVILTHFHVDHVSGLPDLLWGEMWDSQGHRTEPLTLVGPHGLENFYRERLLPFVGDYPLPFDVQLVELGDGERFEGTFYEAGSKKLAHGEFSTGYLFDFAGEKIGITGDTGYCTALEELLRQSDRAVMEWGIPDLESRYEKHISSDDILTLIKNDALPGKVYINHMYLKPGLSFGGHVDKLRAMLGEHAARFFFPVDREIVTLL